ncbi:unnamed protein product [Nippostrongylus brasiliensis]|uniref:Helo_like_N domain-containing protein n=1 Tax=Nippostrongylus brasiliensis TaxID=27835 RepID=A0A0N4XLV7_NIPBR|nr:unnamed protein product [Nippostrongylus brasiliensis]
MTDTILFMHIFVGVATEQSHWATFETQWHDAAIAVLKDLTSSIKSFIDSHDDLKEKKIVLFSSLRDIENLHAKAKETGDLHYVIDNTFTSLNSSKCSEGVAACVHNSLTAAYSRHQAYKKKSFGKADSFTPYWQFSNADSSRLASRFDAETANLLTFMQEFSDERKQASTAFLNEIYNN